MNKNELLDEVKATLVSSGIDPFRAIGATVRVFALVEAHVLAADRAEAWAEGHEDGFWNGRMSSGDTSDVALIGKEHAAATNPYRPAP